MPRTQIFFSCAQTSHSVMHRSVCMSSLVQTKKKSKTLVTWSFSSDLQDQKHFVWSNIEINVVRKQNKDYTVVSHTLLILAGLNFW